MSVTRESAQQEVTTRTAVEVVEPWVTWALLEGWLQASGNWDRAPGGLQRDIRDVNVRQGAGPQDAMAIRSSYRDWTYLLGMLGAMGLPRDLDADNGEAEIALSMLAVQIESLLFPGGDE